MSFAQSAKLEASQSSVDLVLLPVQKNSDLDFNTDFNPNGIRLFNSHETNQVKLQFKKTIPSVSIDVIDKKGRLITNYSGSNLDFVNFDTVQLKKGTYFIRINSDEIEDFLKFVKK
jgi:hypothetical protein